MLSTIFIIIGVIATISVLLKFFIPPQDDSSKSAIQKNQELTQDKFDYFSHQGKIAYQKKQFEQAIKLFDSAYQAKPQNVILIQKAGCYRELKDFEKCMQICNAVIDEDQSFADAYLMRSTCNLGLNNKRQAIEDLRKFIEIEPSK
ncbi:MAG: tetratricopeptide repeat protein [Saprospiraceae bacterium]